MLNINAMLLDKKESLERHGKSIDVDSLQYENAFENMSDEDLYSFIMEDHNDTFKAKDGRPMREVILESSWSAISQDPNIPPEVKAYWSRLPLRERGKKIANYQDNMLKLESNFVILTSKIVASDPGKAEQTTQEIAKELQFAYKKICDGIVDGKDYDNENINNMFQSSIRAKISGVDRNSEEFAFYNSVMGWLDPKTQTWVNC